MYTFERKQKLKTKVEEAWELFSDPHYLSQVSSTSLKLTVVTSTGGPIQVGKINDYHIEIIPGSHQPWTTEITECLELDEFIEEQIEGPYRYWRHRYKFNEAIDGSWITDRISFNVPYSVFGKLTYHLFIKKRLSEFFDARSQYLIENFGAMRAVKSGCL